METSWIKGYNDINNPFIMFTKNFKQLSKSDVSIAGGKGASLGEMTQAGIAVPPGFVVLSGAFEQFVEETGIRADIESVLSKVKHNDANSVEQASEKIQAIILGEGIPKNIAAEIQKEFKKINAKFVAVRSSATSEDSSSAAWAGQLETYLNTTQKDLLLNVKKCWASLFTPRAIFYRFEKGLQKEFISVAVVVQKMVQSEISGIAFSVHPVTQDYNQMIIEAGYGLGEAIVSGSVTPDSYVVKKNEMEIDDVNISKQEKMLAKTAKGNEWVEIPTSNQEKQKLKDEEILELSRLIKKIELHYGFPCDIEWAKEGNKLYITQSRPITTLKPDTDTTPKAEGKITFSKIYSREKTLFYFSMWNDSDRRGWKKFLGHEVKQNLFIIPPPGSKGSVWYSPKELADIEVILKQKLQTDKKLVNSFKKTLDSNWVKLLPYLLDKKELKSVKEFSQYYENLVNWWSAMNTAFNIPEIAEVSKSVKVTFLKYREESEKYTEKMNKVMAIFWHDHFPEFKDITFCISPSEVAELEGPLREEVLKKVRARTSGCVMFNGKIYPISKMELLLSKNNLELEKIQIKGATEIKGKPAYKGLVQGRVKKILSFADMKDFKAGDVLVTEMTNPDYVPLMKIASAVVTDEGGATCHAAIASRELKVPCIVGTKVATHILNDGDMVEVDANKGVVRKIDTGIVNNFLSSLGQNKIIKIDGDFIPYFIATDWLNYYSASGKLKNIYPLFFYKDKDITAAYIDQNGYFECSESIFTKVLESEDFKNKIDAGYEKAKKLLDFEYQQYTSFGKKEEKGLRESFKKVYQSFQDLVVWTLFLDQLDEKIISSVVEKKYSKKVSLEKIFDCVKQYAVRSFELRNKNVALDALTGKVSKEYTEYSFLNYTFVPDRKFINNFYAHSNKIKLGKEIKEAENKIIAQNLSYAKNLAKLNKFETKIVKVIVWTADLRDERRDYLNKADLLLYRLGQDLLKLWAVQKDCVTYSQMVEILQGKKFIQNLKPEFKKRQSNYGYLILPDKTVRTSTEDLSEGVKKLDAMVLAQHGIEDKNTIKGEIGNKGFITGKIRVVLKRSDFDSFQEGEVLVTGMTRPEFVPLMQRAAAIVTDEGGITCHAAIVSRELNKPCVIGTRIATHVLKTGDVVEVDANKGVVKILKRK